MKTKMNPKLESFFLKHGITVDNPNTFQFFDDTSMDGDDAVIFMIEFSKEFNVDLTSMEIDRYLSPTLREIVTNIFTLRKPFRKREGFRIDRLEKAIELGRWN